MRLTQKTDSRYFLFQATGWGLLALINIFFFITFDRLDFQHVRRMMLTVMMGFSISHLMRFHIHKATGSSNHRFCIDHPVLCGDVGIA
jgi:hypothetical protein